MNALTMINEPEAEIPVALALPDDLEFSAWVNLGRDLFTRHRQTEWMLADWLKVGTERFHDEEQFTLFLGEIGVDPKRAIADAKVAKLIPPAWRTDRISFDVCKHIAKVEDEALRQRMLKRAVEEHWNERAASHAIQEHKRDQGQLWEDELDDARRAEVIARAWNREAKSVLEYLWPLLVHSANNGFCAINLDVAIKGDADDDA